MTTRGRANVRAAFTLHSRSRHDFSHRYHSRHHPECLVATLGRLRRLREELCLRTHAQAVLAVCCMLSNCMADRQKASIACHFFSCVRCGRHGQPGWRFPSCRQGQLHQSLVVTPRWLVAVPTRTTRPLWSAFSMWKASPPDIGGSTRGGAQWPADSLGPGRAIRCVYRLQGPRFRPAPPPRPGHSSRGHGPIAPVRRACRAERTYPGNHWDGEIADNGIRRSAWFHDSEGNLLNMIQLLQTG